MHSVKATVRNYRSQEQLLGSLSPYSVSLMKKKKKKSHLYCLKTCQEGADHVHKAATSMVWTTWVWADLLLPEYQDPLSQASDAKLWVVSDLSRGPLLRLPPAFQVAKTTHSTSCLGPRSLFSTVASPGIYHPAPLVSFNSALSSLHRLPIKLSITHVPWGFCWDHHKCRSCRFYQTVWDVIPQKCTGRALNSP